jgi:hypothetical protein
MDAERWAVFKRFLPVACVWCIMTKRRRAGKNHGNSFVVIVHFPSMSFLLK